MGEREREREKVREREREMEGEREERGKRKDGEGDERTYHYYRNVLHMRVGNPAEQKNEENATGEKAHFL